MKKIIFLAGLLFMLSGPVFAGDIQTAGHIQGGTLYHYDIPLSVDNTLGFGCINAGDFASTTGGTVCSKGGIGPVGIRYFFTLDSWISSAVLNTPYTFVMNNGTDNYYFTVYKRGTNNWSLGTAGYNALPAIGGVDCSTFDVGCYLGQAIHYLFMPSQDSLEQFKTLYDQVKNKPPFGYVFAINTALAGLNDTGTSVFSLETVSGLDSYIFTPVRTALIWVLWLLFAFSFYKRVKHLDI